MTDGSIYRRPREGVVIKVSTMQKGGSPDGYIQDKEPGSGRPVHFYNQGHRFKPGQEVIYRCRPGDPDPVATMVWSAEDYRKLRAQQADSGTSPRFGSQPPQERRAICDVDTPPVELHTGRVKRLCSMDKERVPFGFIWDYGTTDIGDVFFRNPGSEFKVGDEVEYRVTDGHPNPVARDIRLKRK